MDKVSVRCKGQEAELRTFCGVKMDINTVRIRCKGRKQNYSLPERKWTESGFEAKVKKRNYALPNR